MRNIFAVGGALIFVLLVGCGKEPEQSSRQEERPDVAVGLAQDTPVAGIATSRDGVIPGAASGVDDQSGSDDDEIDVDQNVVVSTD